MAPINLQVFPPNINLHTRKYGAPIQVQDDSEVWELELKVHLRVYPYLRRGLKMTPKNLEKSDGHKSEMGSKKVP